MQETDTQEIFKRWCSHCISEETHCSWASKRAVRFWRVLVWTAMGRRRSQRESRHYRCKPHRLWSLWGVCSRPGRRDVRYVFQNTAIMFEDIFSTLTRFVPESCLLIWYRFSQRCVSLRWRRSVPSPSRHPALLKNVLTSLWTCLMMKSRRCGFSPSMCYGRSRLTSPSEKTSWILSSQCWRCLKKKEK